MHPDITARLGVLRDEPVNPPWIDVARAMKHGRARRRNHRIAVGGSALAGILAVLATVSTLITPKPVNHQPPVVSPSPTSISGLRCVESTLALPAGDRVFTVHTGDPTGRFTLGDYRAQDGVKEGILWDSGVPRTFRNPDGDVEVMAVNSSGEVIGATQSSSDQNVWTGWVYAKGRFSSLAAPLSAYGSVINGNGQIAGSGALTVAGRPIPVFWSSPTATGTELSTPGPDWVTIPTGIDDDGTVVGTAYNDATIPFQPGRNGTVIPLRIIVWRTDGTYQMLPVPDTRGTWLVVPVAIRHGLVFAEALSKDHPSGPGTPVVYNLSTNRYVSRSGPTFDVRAVNAVGQWAGIQKLWPVAWSNTTGLVRLPSLSPNADTDHSKDVAAISDDGRVLVGNDTDSHRVSHPVRWSCQ